MMQKKKSSGLIKTKTIIGIDYSLTSPAICIADNSFDFNKCQFYFLTNKKKCIGKMSNNITGFEHKEYDTPIKRFSQISDWVFDIIKQTTNQKVFIEGYSFGSKGQAIFQIAENCGILKYRLQESNIPYDTVVPTVVKKKATGKGNADKEKMYEQFVKDTGVNLKKIFDVEKIGNPVSDIVDSFYVARCGYEESN